MAEIWRPDKDTAGCVLVEAKQIPRKSSQKPPPRPPPPPPAPVKRPRGRPRKPRNNTAETAIVLSDSDGGDDNSDHDLAEQRPGAQAKRKRPVPKLDTPTPGPSPKRHAPSAPQPAKSSSLQTEVEQLKQQLSAEKKACAELESQNARLQQAREEQEASAAADLAAHLAPLQLHIQNLTQDNETLRSAARDLENRLQAALDKGRTCTSEGPSPGTAETDDLIKSKDAIIAKQETYIEELSELEECRSQELAEACQKITRLTLTLKQGADSTAENEAFNQKIENLQQELATTKNASAVIAQRLDAAQNKFMTAQQGLADAQQEIAELNDQLARAKTSTATVAENDQQRVKEVKGLIIENTRLREVVTALEKEKKELAQNPASGSTVHNEQDSHDQTIAVLRLTEQDLQRKLALTQERNSSLRTELAQCREELRVLQDEKRQLSATTRKQLADQVQALRAEVRRQHETITSLEREKHLAVPTQPSGDQATRVQQQQRERIAELTRLLASTKAELQRQNDKVDRHGAGKAGIEKDLAAKTLKIQLLQSEVDQRKEKMAEQERQIQDLRTRSESFFQKIRELRGEIATNKAELEKRSALLADQQDAIVAKQIEISQVQQSLATATADKSQLQHELVAYKSRLQQLAAKLSEVAAENKQLSATTLARDETIKNLKDVITTITAERDSLAEQNTFHQTELASLKAFLSTSSDSIADLTSRLTASESESHTLRQSLLSLEAEKASAADLVTELQAQLTRLQDTPTTATTKLHVATTTRTAHSEPPPHTGTTPTTPLLNRGNTPGTPITVFSAPGQLELTSEDDHSSKHDDQDATPAPTDLEERICLLSTENSELRIECDAQSARVAQLREQLAQVLGQVEGLEEEAGRGRERVRGLVAGVLPGWMKMG